MSFLKKRLHKTIRDSVFSLTFGAACILAAPVSAQVASDVKTTVALPNFTQVYNDNKNAVVNIRSVQKIKLRQRGGQSDLDELFRQFFGEAFPSSKDFLFEEQEDESNDQDEIEQSAGVGSGFILTSDGYIMTNAHVVRGADDLIVTLADKREFKAKVIGQDRRSDIAVVKIDAKNLNAVRIGDIDKLQVGEWVVAIGSPFGLENTLTAGIVSTKQRDTGEYLPFIQTDVAINPGNSGGPLINMRGEVVGINSQIYSRSGGSMGIAFAIPIDEAIRIANQLRERGFIERARLGVQITPLGQEEAKALGLPNAKGAFVRNVEENSPALKAGIEAGDIITKINGKELDSYADVVRKIGSNKPGSKVVLEVYREGKTKQINVTLTTAKTEKNTEKLENNKKESADQEHKLSNLGLTIRNLTSAEKKRLQINHGVLITEATAPASRAGLRKGGILVAIANTKVTDVAQVKSILDKQGANNPVGLLVRQQDGTIYVLITPKKQ